MNLWHPLLLVVVGRRSSWTRFDLTDRRPHLDSSAQSLLDAREASLVARRRLGDATKSLKRALKSAEDDDVFFSAAAAPSGGDDDDGDGGTTTTTTTTTTVRAIAAECMSTIRMYQEEIDAITRRCKSAEGAFAQLYRGLHDCPDPADVMRDAKRLLEGRDARVDALSRGMEELRMELGRSVDERARLADEMRERERELNDAMIKKSQGSGAGGGGGGGELSLAEREELIRLRGEVAEFEVEFRGLKNQDITIRKLEGARRIRGTTCRRGPRAGGRGMNDYDYPSGEGYLGVPQAPTAGAMSERKAYEAEIEELSITCSALREELRSKEDSASEERRSLRTTIDSLERERSSLSNRVSSLEMQVVNAPSQDVVDKMRHELRILKRLEYNAVDYDHRDPEMTHPDIAGKDEDDLESVLVAKLRKVEADLVRERREKNEGHKVRDELNQRLLAVQKSLDDAQELIASLENDLQVAVATLTSCTSTPVIGQSGDMPYGSVNPPDPNTLQRILDPKVPPVLPQDIGNATVTSAASPSEKAQDDHSVATIIMAQRDRLRSRCDALEAERDSFKRELQIQVQASEGLKTDNSKLYEKVRYLQSFNAGGYSKGGSGVSGGAFVRGRGSGDLDLEALEQRYEASVDPFRQFSRTERQRKFNEMSPMEKIVYIVAKTTLGSKEMRTTLFFYVLAMHLLVFVTTYKWSHSTTCDYYHSQPNLAHFHGGVPLENVAGAVVNASDEVTSARIMG
ncbi:hypothetical protein ACHAW5_007128 [Stephanodiscus triporus]|uniref:Protein CASP n=1 Tax=Stephanodiscus triporus TaxID=2934178 RepID=A0ABD3NA77_9STRA